MFVLKNKIYSIISIISTTSITSIIIILIQETFEWGFKQRFIWEKLRKIIEMVKIKIM